MKPLREIISEGFSDSARRWVEHRRIEFFNRYGRQMPQSTIKRLYSRASTMYKEGRRYDPKTHEMDRRKGAKRVARKRVRNRVVRHGKQRITRLRRHRSSNIPTKSK